MKKNMMMNLIIIGVIASGVIVFGFINYQKNKNYREITKYVNTNYKSLEEIASNYMKNNKAELPDKVKKVEVFTAEDKHNTIVQFTYATENKKEYGFYYSVEDRAEAFNIMNVDLLELGGNKYMWESPNQKEGTTSKIRDSWYYYKVSK